MLQMAGVLEVQAAKLRKRCTLHAAGHHIRNRNYKPVEAT